MASSDGYYAKIGEAYYEYDKSGKFTETVPASLYSSSNAFLDDDIQVAEVK